MTRVIFAVIGASLFASAAFAQVEREPYEVKVSALGVNFHDPAATAAFYSRLQIAAATACNSRAPQDLGASLADHRCAHLALVAAVKSINEPMLSEAAGLPATTALASNAH